MPLQMDIPALERFLAEAFPQLETSGVTIAQLDEHRIVLRLDATHSHLRPGGTVSGPVLMTLADTTAYLLILANIGPVALAVTTNLNIHFVRKADPGQLFATGSLLKLGSRIAVVEIRMHGADPNDLFAHATATYSIPRPR